MIKSWRPLLATDKKYAIDALKRREMAGQNSYYTKKFEKNWAEYLGIDYSILTNSGTAALHMAVEALNLEKESEVIMPVVSFTSTALSVLYQGLIPVFCDIKGSDLNLDEDKIEDKITSQTRAIIVVHLNGFPANMAKIKTIATKHNLKIIEDACQAHGAAINDQRVGTFGDIATFSLNRFKNLPAGEGGMMVTNNEEYFKSAKSFYNFGVYGDPASFNSKKIGYMYRSTELTAAIACSRLQKLDDWNKKRRQNASRLNKAIDKLEKFEILAPAEGTTAVYWKYLFKVKSDDLNYVKKITQFLRNNGIAVSEWQRYNLSEHEVFKPFDKGDLSYSKNISNQIIWLEDVVNPLNGRKEIDYAIKIITQASKI